MAPTLQPSPVVLVTGASRGLGRGIALQLSGMGCSVAINYCGQEAAAAETAELCRKAAASPGQKFIPLQADIAAAPQRRRLLAQTLAQFGRLDGLVNNAGMAPRVRADLTEATEESYEEVMRVNLTGPHFLTQLVARHWLAAPAPALLPGGPKIVFVTSLSADTATVNRSEYCLSKAGLSMAAQLWATRLAGDGIQVLEVRPGVMATDMTAGVKEKYEALFAAGLVPQRRWGTAEDVGLAVRAIFSGLFPFSTGAIIPVDGGFNLRRL